MPTNQYEIVYPDGLDDLEWSMVESKGCLFGVKIRVGIHTIEPSFYDKVRLLQDVEAELELSGCFAEPAVIVVESVTKRMIERAVERLAVAGILERLKRAS